MKTGEAINHEIVIILKIYSTMLEPTDFKRATLYFKAFAQT